MIRSNHPRLRGQTLIELVISLASATVLMVGLSSALLVSFRGANGDFAAAKSIEGSAAVEVIVADLRDATTVSEQTQTSIEVTVPDRNDDGQPDLVRYEWGGTPGDALMREFNGSVPVAMADDVHIFEFGYQTRSYEVDSDTATTPVQILKNYESGSTSDHSVKSDLSVGVYFEPAALPAETVSWSVTRVDLRLKQNDSNQNFSVKLHTAKDSGLPGAKLEKITRNSNSLGTSYAWHSFEFTAVRDLLPDEALCIAVTAGNVDSPCRAEYCSGGVSDPDVGLLVRNNDDPWFKVSDKCLWFRVYGTVTTSAGTTTVFEDRLTFVDVSLQVGDREAARLDGTAQLRHQPPAIP